MRVTSPEVLAAIALRGGEECARCRAWHRASPEARIFHARRRHPEEVSQDGR